MKWPNLPFGVSDQIDSQLNNYCNMKFTPQYRDKNYYAVWLVSSSTV